MFYMKVVKGVNHKCSHDKEKKIFFYFFNSDVYIYIYIYDGNSLNLWQSFHDIFKSNQYAVYTLNLYSAICQFVIVWSPSHVQLFVTPGTVARQAPLSVGFSRQR